MRRYVLVDLDGVLCNFNERVLQVFNKPDYEVTKWSFFKDWGLTTQEFWQKIDETPGFWENLKPYPWMNELLDFIENRANFFLVSSPSWNASSYSGKRKWVQKYFGKEFNRLTITNHKELLAKKNAVLLDDSDSNCKKFLEAGGIPLLFPQPWNAAHTCVPNRIEFVKNRLRAEFARF